MSIGSSGRIVIEIDPETKRRLYAALITNGLSLKEWFVIEAKKYVESAVERSGDQQTLTGTHDEK